MFKIEYPKINIEICSGILCIILNLSGFFLKFFLDIQHFF